MLKVSATNKLAWTALAFASLMPVAICRTEAGGTIKPKQRVVDALARAGVVVDPHQIEFLSGSHGSGEGADLMVVSVTGGGSDAAKVKMRCRNRIECLPFYVLVRGLDGVNANSSRSGAVPVRPTVSPSDIVRRGDHATLILESPDARMSFPVICLQSGVRGQHVRAASPDRKHFYEAEVVAPGMLRGSL